MNNFEFLFDKLDEECKEVALVCNKIKQFGLDSNFNGQLPNTNREELFRELNDVLATVIMLNQECNLGFVPDIEAIKLKIEKVKYFRSLRVVN